MDALPRAVAIPTSSIALPLRSPRSSIDSIVLYVNEGSAVSVSNAPQDREGFGRIAIAPSTGSFLGGSTSKAETDSVLVSIRQTQNRVPGTDQTKPWRCMEHAHQSVHRGHAAERRHPRRGAQDSGRISPLGQVTQRHQRKAWAGRQREAARCVHAFTGASGSRNACSPASDTSIHLESGLASAS